MLRKGGPRRRGALRVLLVSFGVPLLAPGLAPPAASAAPATATWYAGASAASITPPAYNPADDARDFPACNTTIYNGRRLFDFEEPYIDRAGTGAFDYTQDAYCDADNNGRYDGLYDSGGIDHLMTWVQSPIWARALAISDGTHTVVLESVTSQGLGREDMLRIRSAADGYAPVSGLPAIGETFVSSTHNESSPDPIGIYGAPADPTGTVGLHSGIDDYYVSFLVQQAAQAARQAADAMRAARMRVGTFTPPDVRARLSTTFLTTDSNRSVTSGPTADGTPEATDAKALVLQLSDAGTGANIETVLSWAAHNQQTGHAPDDSVAPDPADGGTLKPINLAVSDDWPGIFASTVENALGGQAMFVVGTNGSIEDPHTYPLPDPDTECPPTDFSPPRATGTDEGCVTLPRLTGTRLGNDVLGLVGGSSALGPMTDVAPHPITWATPSFDVPLQNQLFDAAFAAGLFAHHTVATASPCQDSTGAARVCFVTEVGLIDLGPQLQVLVNPGESYPALVEGHPFGVDEISCPERPEPPTPDWHASADFKMQVGLGDDMVGYEIPAPGWFADPGVYTDPSCPQGAQAQSNPAADYDQYDSYHKLESESVGPDTGNLVAGHLAALADCAATGVLTSCAATTAATCQAGSRTIEPGRFLLADGTLTRRGRDGPVGLCVEPCGSTALTPGTGTLVALAGIGGFGTTPVTATGRFIDFDGALQDAPDINTRGMVVTHADGSSTRYFVDPYAQLTGSSPGPAQSAPQLAEWPAGGATALLGLGAMAAVALRRRRSAR